MKLSKIFYSSSIVIYTFFFLFSTQSCISNKQLYTAKPKIKNFLYSDIVPGNDLIIRNDLDSVFKENKLNLIVDYDTTDYSFITTGDSSNKKITVSKKILKILKEKYNFFSYQPVIEGILAHEYGHVKQIEKEPYISSESIISYKEFQADFLAGFYLGKKYGYSFLEKPIHDNSVIDGIKYTLCSFASFAKNREKHPEMFAAFAMLMSSDFEHQNSKKLVQMMYGMNPDTVSILRFTALWTGFRSSGIKDIDDIYLYSSEYIKKYISKSTTAKAFFIIGTDGILNVLSGKYTYIQMINRASKDIISSKILRSVDRLAYSFVLRSVASSCK